MDAPDVLGAAEAAEVLDVELPRITRWRISGHLPKPAVELAATPVWERVVVEAVRDGLKPPPWRSLPLVSTKEAADMLDRVDKSQIGRWRRAERFPEPCAQLAAGPLWWRKDVQRFKRMLAKDEQLREEKKAAKSKKGKRTRSRTVAAS